MTTSTPNSSEQPFLPGRLGNPKRVLKTDPRADPRLVAACAPFALDVAPPPIPVTADSPLQDKLGSVSNLLILKGEATMVDGREGGTKRSPLPEGGKAMAVEAVRCPHCQGEAVGKYGTGSNGKARYRCQQADQCGRTFIRAYAYLGCVPEVKRQIVEMTLNGSGVRDIARVLQVSPTTVSGELKKRPVRSPKLTQWSWRGAVPKRSR